MDLAEKMKHLRAVEGDLRGLNRPMTQVEVVTAMQHELGVKVSQAYISQLERSKRLHLTASSRDVLSRFFKVHPSYLISDPLGYSTDLVSDMDADGDRLATWLAASSQEWYAEPEVQAFFQRLAHVEDPRHYFTLFVRLMSLSKEELESVVDALTNISADTD